MIYSDAISRSIAELLMKFCTCWTSDTKHESCLESYEEFLVTINNRLVVSYIKLVKLSFD